MVSARALHFVLKIGDRAANANFFRNILGMRVRIDRRVARDSFFSAYLNRSMNQNANAICLLATRMNDTMNCTIVILSLCK